MKPVCPACGLRLAHIQINLDCGYCPDHDEITGLLMLKCRGLPRWKALIEIRGYQAKRYIQMMADAARCEFTGGMIQRGIYG